MIKAVIFDMDGLIVDTEVVESQAIEKMLTAYGKKPQIRPTGLVHEIGLGMELYDILKEQYHLTENIQEIQKKKQDYFEQLIKSKNLSPYDGVISLLKQIKENHLKIALASNRNIHHINIILEELQIFDYFEVIVDPSDTRKHKPHPDIYLETAKQLNVQPAYCLALEDTESGVRSADAADMKVIAVPNGYSKKHDFSKADMIVNSLKSVTMELINSI